MELMHKLVPPHQQHTTISTAALVYFGLLNYRPQVEGKVVQIAVDKVHGDNRVGNGVTRKAWHKELTVGFCSADSYQISFFFLLLF